ncbi:hypothetical protein BHM03_00020746, partial [Ensete ventricosum]
SQTKMVKAVVVLGSSESVKGTVYFAQEGDGPTTVTGTISGLKAGLHGFHVHALGDTTNGCMSTEKDIAFGLVIVLNFCILQIPLSGPNSIIGRAVVVHADPDDLGKGAVHFFRL